MRSYVQLGVVPLCVMSDDGPVAIEPVLRAAQRRGMRTIVVAATAELKAWRALGVEIGAHVLSLARMRDVPAIVAALAELGVGRGDLVLPGPGFNPLTSIAYEVAAGLGAEPAAGACGFRPIDKLEVRRRLARVPQPAWTALALASELGAFEAALARIGAPAVLKLTGLAGGDGVVHVGNASELERALATLRCVAVHFAERQELELASVLVERFVAGADRSVQGVVAGGRVDVLTVCERVVTHSSDGHFADAAYIAHAPLPADAALLAATDAVIAAVDYRNGPFHIDVVDDGATVRVLEIDFRFSAPRLVESVSRACGRDWAETALDAERGEHCASAPRTRRAVGSINLLETPSADVLSRGDHVRVEVRAVRRGLIDEPARRAELAATYQVVLEAHDVASVRRALAPLLEAKAAGPPASMA